MDRQLVAGRTNVVPRTRSWGVALAAGTALVSGVAVFVNSYGVRRFPDATTYTTAKNLVAALVLVGLVRIATVSCTDEGWTAPRTARQRLGLVAVGVIGGGVAFVLFFEGLSQAASTDAAFIHKTLLVWVAVLAVPLLKERLGVPHVLAIGLLIWGQAALAGDLASLRMGRAEVMIGAATVLWAVEIVIAKKLLGSEISSLTVGVARMALGTIALLAWAIARGELGTLLGVGASAWGWALLTGGLLALYVASWYAALARAQAVDTTAVLVLGALVTALLDSIVNGTPLSPDLAGLALVLGGGTVAVVAALRARPSRAAMT